MEKKKHILLVDDDELARQLFGFKLAGAGFEVLYAEDGNIGREMARRFQPDLILMDIEMPVMDGLKACSMIKNESQTSNIPVIFLTNTDMSIEAQKAVKELGAEEYIPKAADPEKLISTIKKVLLASASKQC